MREKLSTGWHRIGKCQACYYHRWFMSDTSKMARPDIVTHHHWYLYSYSTPILAIYSHRSDVLQNTNWHIMVNVDYWQCSNTTRQHISKFLLSIVGSPVWYHELKEVVTQIQKSVFRDNICPNHHNVRVFLRDSAEMRAIFNKVPYCNCRY